MSAGAYAILLAGGSGDRMGAGENKVFLRLRGIPAIVRALAPFSTLCDGVIVVARACDADEMRAVLQRYGMSRLTSAVVVGGEDRQASVANGLAAVPKDAKIVLVHDGARALVDESVIRRVLDSTSAYGTGVAALPVTDTVKRADADGVVLQTLERSELYAMQTPQGFRADWLIEAHAKALRDGFRATDDAALLEHAGRPVRLCAGSRDNIKLTTPFDLALADLILARREGENP